MRVFQINSCSYGSTGMIMRAIHDELRILGNESCVAWARGRDAVEKNGEIKFNSRAGVYRHVLGARLFDGVGRYSRKATARLISTIDKFDPDIVHLHNVHGYCLHMKTLFNYLSQRRQPVVWTFHSCWPFTGHCSYFTYVKCEQWITHCSYCPQVHEFPKSFFFDGSKRNYDEKKRLFTSVENLTIVTPSKWLADLTRNSFFRKTRCETIYNGIDTSLFNSKVNGALVREGLNLQEKKVLLSVASPWSERKGLQDLIELRELLDDRFAMVVVGLDKRQIASMPKGIIGVKQTSSPQQLAQYYAMADLFVNPTHDDNYPTVNLESLACGTRVLTYNTGGSPECASYPDCIVTLSNTPQELAKNIERYFASHEGISNTSVLDASACARNYVDLYKELLNEGIEHGF